MEPLLQVDMVGIEDSSGSAVGDNEYLVLFLVLVESKNASTIIEQTISVAGETKVNLKLQLVYVDTHTLRPTRIPEILKQKFEDNMKGN